MFTSANLRVAAFGSVMQHVPRHLAFSVRWLSSFFADVAGFRAHPAQVAAIAAVVPDDDLGLELPHQRVGVRPVVIGLRVNLAILIRAAVPARAAVRAVEPRFKHRAILREQLRQLIAEMGDVFRLAVISAIAIPGEIDAKLQPVFLAGGGRRDIACPFSTGRSSRNTRCISRARSKTAVMLRHEDHPVIPASLQTRTHSRASRFVGLKRLMFSFPKPHD